MDSVFITLSTFNSIIASLELINPSKSGLKEPIYKTPVFFLSRSEEDRILRQKGFLKNPYELLHAYKKKAKTDTFHYVYEGGQSRYHRESDCEALNSTFKNYAIPPEIEKDQILLFREFWKENFELFNDKDTWLDKAKAVFGTITIPAEVIYDNSGLHNMANINLDNLEQKIDEILACSVDFYNNNPDKQDLILHFAKFTWLKTKKEPIQNKKVPVSDEELKAFLDQYDIQFKQPFKSLLLQYDMVKYNPELKFQGLLLEQLGLKPCAKCFL